MRIAVVTARTDVRWREEEVVVRRVAGALACTGEVEMLVAGGTETAEEWDGAVSVRRFPIAPTSEARRRTPIAALFGEEVSGTPIPCACASHVIARIAADAPRTLQNEVLAAMGGEAPLLAEHLRRNAYDVVVFGGYRFATPLLVAAVPATSRVVVVPMAREEPLLHLSVVGELFERADRVLVLTTTERDVVEDHFGLDGSDRVTNVGFALRVARLAAVTEPNGFEGRPVVIVPATDTHPSAIARVLDGARRTGWPGGDLDLCVAGAEGTPSVSGASVRTCRSRMDLWRWMARAVAVLDPSPGRVLGRDVLEAMLYGVPVIVDERGGAAREHAEAGNGGLWYRDAEDLAACVEALRSGKTREGLGAQGRRYAEERYGDAEAFVRRVTEAVAG